MKYTACQLLGIASLVLCSQIQESAALTLTNAYPAHASIGVVRDTDIVTGFSGGIDFATVNESSFRVWGNHSGFYTGTFHQGSVIFSNLSRFKPGERIFTMLTTNILDTNGLSLSGYQFEFVAETEGCTQFQFVVSQDLLLSTNADYSAELGDFDGDEDLDLFMASDNGDLVMFNDGNGSFSIHQRLAASQGRRVCLGDFDSDGDLDAAVAVTVLGDSLVYINDGNGMFTSNALPGSTPAFSVAAGDFNGDGHLDLVLGMLGSSDLTYVNDGNANFTIDQVLSTAITEGLDVGDIDGDGDLDIVAATTGGADLIYENDGFGTFATNLFPGTAVTFDIALGDFDHDGDLDAMAAVFNGPDLVYSNDGAGNFTVSQQLSSDDGRGVSLADIDGDGDLDAFVAASSDGINIYLNNGLGSFAMGDTINTTFVRDVTSGDIDGDGDVDLVPAITPASLLAYTTKLWLNLHCDDTGDFDDDGLPNSLEVSDPMLNPEDPKDATLDTDSDTFSTLEEFIAGTQWTNSESFFKIDKHRGDGIAEVSFHTKSGRLYSVSYLDMLVATQSWQSLSNGILGDNERVWISDPVSTNLRNYRIGVRMD